MSARHDDTDRKKSKKSITLPPGSFIKQSTFIPGPDAIILIFGCEGVTTMMRKRITSGF